ncbi:NlpC/P60 family protein [Falsihalocynthiibacter sp. SS001]|uniref:NlpC/P60 family protein n=1 Tax=Falsihalocynthiibacter sp. SS001 TaxID=3349698 RepID=UPI0036D34365
MRRDEVAGAARGWIGTPYCHQASVKGAGTDCLGLLRGVWRELLGAEPMPVPAYTADWNEPQGDEALLYAARETLREKPLECAETGDVILFRMRSGAVAKHLGIQGNVGDAPSFIHAYSGHEVVESPLSDPWKRRLVARFEFPEEGS